MIPNDEHLYIDAADLYERGWTETLIKQFLVHPDRMRTVDHWLNYTGKRCYFLGRVEEAEINLGFIAAFNRSLRRRKLGPQVVDKIFLQRKSTQGQVKQFVESLTDEDIKFSKVIHQAAAIIEEARNHGFRTPNK
jgi:hypothetical protein